MKPFVRKKIPATINLLICYCCNFHCGDTYTLFYIHSLYIFVVKKGTWKLKQGPDEDTRMIYSSLFDGYIAVDENRVVVTKVTNLMFFFHVFLFTFTGCS